MRQAIGYDEQAGRFHISCPGFGYSDLYFVDEKTFTQAAMAKLRELLGRRGIGIEIDEGYYEIALKRVEDAVRKRE